MVFHTRDFMITERADYFAAGASVLYGLYYSPIRVFRLDDPERNRPYKKSLLRLWTVACIGLYLAHVSYLTMWSWDYIQYGGEHCSGDCAERSVDMVQLREIQEVGKAVAGLAGYDSGVDSFGNEHGGIGFCAVEVDD